MGHTKQNAGSDLIRFDTFELDARRGVLSKSGQRIKLQPQPFRVLHHLVTKAPDVVSREELAAAVWAGIHVDVDLSLNYCVRQIRSALDDSAATAKYVETLPKQGYRFVGAVVFESTAAENVIQSASVTANVVERAESQAKGLNGSKLQGHEEVGEGRDRLLSPRRRMAVASALVALITLTIGAVTLAIWYRLRQRHDGGPPPIRSIAVLPLDNFSGDSAQNYLADGMTEELITMLAKTSTLRVVSRTSVMQYRGVHRPIREIAKELGVDGILEGSVSRSGDQVHMTIQLIRGTSDTHLWADSYDRPFDGLAPLSKEVAEKIGRYTHTLTAVSHPPQTVSPAAHDAYLHGRYLWYITGQNEAAGRYFRRAIELQPDYALAWSGLANYYGAGTMIEQHELDPREALSLEETAAKRAVQFDDSVAEAHLALGVAIFFNRWDWSKAEAEVDRSIELDPNLAQAFHSRSKILLAMNRPKEAIQAQKTADELDPFARPWAIAATLDLARQYDDALHEALQRISAGPHDPYMQEVLSDIYRDKHMEKEGVYAFAKWLDDTGNAPSATAIRGVFRRGGYQAVLRWRLRDLERRSKKDYVSPMDFAGIYAATGDKEQTLAALEESYRQRSPPLIWIQQMELFDFLHAEPRYRSLIQRMNLPPAY